MRQARGWSQQHAALIAGISIDTLKSIEIERACPSLKTAYKLKNAFGCSCIDELIDEAI
ncbi:helix-turn-helix protein [compost metagenome]